MENPNKYVRKAIYDAVNSTYPCFDTQVTGKRNPHSIVIFSTKDKEIDKATKWGSRWVSYTLLDIVNIHNGSGNAGSRLASDDMENAILALIDGLTVDGYAILNTRYEFPSSFNSSTSTQTVYRNFIRVILTLE